MKTYTVHLRPVSHRRPGGPVLVPEGFSWGAFLFGPFWLAWRRAWVAALLLTAGLLVLSRIMPGPVGSLAGLLVALAVGVFGRDLWRRRLEGRGYVLVHVVAGRGEFAAWDRLLAARPDLAARAAR